MQLFLVELRLILSKNILATSIARMRGCRKPLLKSRHIFIPNFMLKRTINVLKYFIVAVPLLLLGCQTENWDPKQNQSLDDLKSQLNPVLTQELPAEVEEQLQRTSQNLAKYMGNALVIEQVDVLGELSTDNSLKASQVVISENTSFVASGNITEPSTVKVGELQRLYPDELSRAKQAVQEIVSTEVKAGDKVMEITWRSKDLKFKTQCFYRNSGIVWDNVLSGLIIMEPKPDVEISTLKASSRTYRSWWTAHWLWGSKRGEMGYQIKIYYSGSKVSNTDVSDWAYISLGKAESKSKIVKNSGSYGKCRYALGLCTPLGSLSFNHSNFSVSFSGLGSNIVANGYKSLYP